MDLAVPAGGLPEQKAVAAGEAWLPAGSAAAASVVAVLGAAASAAAVAVFDADVHSDPMVKNEIRV